MCAPDVRPFWIRQRGFWGSPASCRQGWAKIFNDLGTNTENCVAHGSHGNGSSSGVVQKILKNQLFLYTVKNSVTLWAGKRREEKMVSIHRIFRKMLSFGVRINSLVSEIEQCEKKSKSPSPITGKVETLRVCRPARQSAFRCGQAWLVLRTPTVSTACATFLQKSARASAISTNF